MLGLYLPLFEQNRTVHIMAPNEFGIGSHTFMNVLTWAQKYGES
jgi:hypothetical protein